MQTLSAPEFNKFLISWEFLIPPPTVRGTKHSDEAHSINSVFGCRFSLEAVISNITISSTSHFTKNSIAVYSFALHPEDHQPSGTMNFSTVKNAYLNNNLYNGQKAENEKYTLYAVNYNILRILSGQAGLAYV